MKNNAKELLTASRMATFLACPRKHFYSYELGLKADTDSTALRLGTAMHRGLEERAKGADFETAYRAAISSGSLDQYMAATIYGLLGGYYARYGETDELVQDMAPELQFRHPIDGSRTFDSAGKIDGIGTVGGETVIVEHKTTGESIDPASSYWERLAFNPQLLKYRVGAASLGYDIRKVIYDVIKKPSIAPKEIPQLDADGLKVVLDANGNRAMKKDGTPKQSAKAELGEVMAKAMETPEQFGDRLLADTRERPDFYYQRREVYIDGDQAEEFEIQQRGVCKAILHYKAEARRAALPEYGWPRNCNGMSCPGCEYKGICLNSVHVDPARPPDGFRISAPNPELEENNGNSNSK